MIRSRRFLVTLVLPIVTFGSACDGSAGSSGGNAPRTDAGATEPPSEGTGAIPPGDPDGIDHILSTGQSNSISFAGRPVLTSEQGFGNLMFDTGVMTASACDPDGCARYDKPRALLPLVEGDAFFDYAVETMSSGLANEITKLSRARGPSPSVLVSIHGRSGNPYVCLRKGGCSFFDGRGYVKPFDEALLQIADARALAMAAVRPYRITAVTVIHGESDHYASVFPIDGTDGSPDAIKNYADALLEWQRDYDVAVRAATGQAWTVRLFASQMSNWNDRPNSEIPTRQLEAHERSGGKVVLVGPTYALPYAADCIHFTSAGQRRLGEYFAKAYERVVVEGGRWEPLRPAQVTLSGSVVVARFLVPKPPLVLDTTRVTDPGNDGFELIDAGGSTVAIRSVAISAPDTVTLTFAAGAAPPARLRYAFSARPQTCPGPEFGPRGNLRDSDDTPSNYGYELHNWAVHFDVPVR